jgi:hypothetical protein
LAERDKPWLLSSDSIDNSERSELIDWFSRILCKLDQNLESTLDIDSWPHNIKKLTNGLGSFVLHDIFVLDKT